MATTSKLFTIFLVLTLILASIEARVVYDVHACSQFGEWQRECAGPGTVACDVAYMSDAYCISRCYNNVCSNSQDAARGFKKYICESFGIAADYVTGTDGQVSLAIHRLADPSCSTYENTYDFVPTGKLY